MNLPLRFNFIPYPLWRRDVPAPLGALLRPLFGALLMADADEHPPVTPRELAHTLARWRLLPAGMEVGAARRALENYTPQVETVALNVKPTGHASHRPLRLPAQWEPVEAVVLAWPAYYPPLWETHAQIVEAICPVARVDILLPVPQWAGAVDLWLTARGIDRSRVRLLHLPTDDIWVRDYGPIVALDEEGRQVVVDAIFNPLAQYPQRRDNAMAARWAAHQHLPVRALNLHIEGGNLWSDGAGTLLMSDELISRHAALGLDRAEVERRLQQVFAFDKLILTPHLRYEETGHIDLVCKLADARTVLVNAPSSRVNGLRLAAVRDRLRKTTNAAGESYQVIELPLPPAYLNWGVYPVWRSYTNALTVNGRVLVPVFGLSSDQEALRLYHAAMPDHEVIAIESRAAANGGGAVHCLTKEIPAAAR